MALTINIDSQIVVQTAAQWAADNTVYSDKRILVTSDVFFTGTDQRKYKIADGVQTWSNLDYFPDAKDLADAAEADAKAYADGLVVGLWDDRGSYDASSGAYPSSGGSGTAGAILKGDIWTISVAGTLPTGQIVEVGDVIRALVDTPGNTQGNWAIQQNNIGYTAENSANKTDTMAGNTASSTKYLSAKGVYDWAIATFQAALGFTPENVSNKSTNTSLGNSDTLYPTQNAVKTYVDNQAGAADFALLRSLNP